MFLSFQINLTKTEVIFNTVKCTINTHCDFERKTVVALCFSCFIGLLNGFRLLKVIQADNFTRCETFAKILSRSNDFVKKWTSFFFRFDLDCWFFRQLCFHLVFCNFIRQLWFFSLNLEISYLDTILYI